MFTYSWNASRPLREGEGHPAHFVELRPGSLTPLASTANDYFMDRGVQRSETYTGIENGSMQDAAIQESMGIIFDRTLEHVGTTDRAIIFLRNLYLAAVRDQMEGAEPALPRNPGAFRVRSVSAVLDRGVPFEEGRKEMERG
jgi:hypothetical protein